MADDASQLNLRVLGSTEIAPRVSLTADDKLAVDPGVFDAFRAANAKKFRGFEAPEAIIQAFLDAPKPYLNRALLTRYRDGDHPAADRWFRGYACAG